jgi:16S rRNA (uracil1498-N3)-methyltransferase
MARERWLLAPDGWEGIAGEVALDPAESRHAISVLRCRQGEELHLIDGRGRHGVGIIAEARKGQVVAAVEMVDQAPPSPSGVAIALGILHSQAMDWAIQKCVEIGVDRFVPVMTDRSQGGDAISRRRRDHWHEVGRQALKQCRRLWAMALEPPASLDEVAAGRPGLYGDPSGGAFPVAVGEGSTVLLVGPEGGLTTEEISLLDARGWRSVVLGPHVLRAETAAVVGGARLAMDRWYTPAP